ncbi:MAG: sensor histidine kinase [Lachnospiraceae bacterium]|jgi:signal transduction histidine kinase
MKIRTKLQLTFVVMVLLPVVLGAASVNFVFHVQSQRLKKIYDIEEDLDLNSLVSPMNMLSEISQSVYKIVNEQAKENPDNFTDPEWLEAMGETLRDRLSSAIVYADGVQIYSNSSLTLSDVFSALPDTKSLLYDEGAGYYLYGDSPTIIRTVPFVTSSGTNGVVYLMTSTEDVLPRIRSMLTEVLLIILLVLIFTSFILDYWLYLSIIIPLDRLKLVATNVRDGNLDFEIPVGGKDEFSEVLADFEDMRRRLKESADERLKNDAEEKELIRNISHDLKTPLASIRGYAEGLRDGVARTPEKQRKYILTICNKTQDMDRLINELTLYSRLDTNRIPYNFTDLSVRTYFNDCVSEISLDLDAQNISLEYTYHPEQDMIITADPEQLKRVVNNIISNSVKYMDPSRPGKIRIDIYDEGEYAHIAMADNGKGIEASALPKIFDRFYRTDRARNSSTGGSGIGLAIVRKIIQDHGGKIWAESVEGQGTTMHIDLKKKVTGPAPALPQKEETGRRGRRKRQREKE